jgi:hypothetical protein
MDTAMTERTIAPFQISTDEDFRFQYVFANLDMSGRSLRVIVKERATNTTRATLTIGSGLTLTGTDTVTGSVVQSTSSAWPRGEYEVDLHDITGGSNTRIVAGRAILDLPGNLVYGVRGNKATVTMVGNQAVVTAIGGIGPPGPANVLSIGDVTTLETGEPATAEITGTAPAQVLNLGLPKGDTGTAATVAVGSTTTGAPGSEAEVVNSGTESAAVLNFTIPGPAPVADGDKGDIEVSDAGSTWSLGAGVLRDDHLPNDLVYLPAIRKRLRNMPDLGDYGISSSGVTDYGQSDFDALTAGLVADEKRRCFAPAGNYRLGEQITFGRGVILDGESKSSSVFKMYHPNTGFVFTGADENGGGLRNLSVVNDSGTTAVAYVQLIAALGGTAPDFFFIDECNFTGFSAATSAYGIIFNGNARDGSAPNGLKGVRNTFIRNTQVFNCNSASVELRQSRGIILCGLEIYQADGAVQKISITGADATKPSSGVRMLGCVLGDVSVDYADTVRGRDNTIANVTVTAKASIGYIGVATGGVTNSGTNFVVEGFV